MDLGLRCYEEHPVDSNVQPGSMAILSLIFCELYLVVKLV